MRRLLIIALSSAAIAGWAIVLAQPIEPANPWFGAVLPAGLGDPHRPVTEVSSLKPAAAIVPAGEEGNRDLEGSAIVEAMEQPMGFGISNQAPYIAALGTRAMTRYGFNLRPTFSNSTAGDLGGYAPLNVPRVQAIHSGPMYHTSGDVLDSISVPGLERAARFYAYFVADVAKADRKDLQP